MSSRHQFQNCNGSFLYIPFFVFSILIKISSKYFFLRNFKLFVSWNEYEETGIQDMCRQMVGICTRIRIPVCASSGNTYDNECMLNEAICVQNRTNTEKNLQTEDNEVALFKMFDGVCPTNEIASTRGKQILTFLHRFGMLN